MTITKIHIQGFKALQDVIFEPGIVNVIVGANGVGKSALLEAVGMLSAAVDGIVDAESLHRRGVRMGNPAIFKTALKGSKTSRNISLSAHEDDDVGFKVTLTNSIKRPKLQWEFVERGVDVGDGKLVEGIEIPQRAWGLIQHLRDFRIFTPTTPVLRGVARDPAQVPPLGLSGGNLAECVGEILADEAKGQQLLDAIRDLFPWVEEIGVVSPSMALIPPGLPMTRQIIVFTDRRMQAGRNQFSAYDAGEGLVHALFLFTLALHPYTPSFFAVDNVGVSLHPRLRPKLISRFCDLLLENGGRQAILTTHDPLILDGLPLWDDRVRLFTMDRDGAGRATICNVSTLDEEFQKPKTEKKAALSELWFEGWLGGV